MDPAEHGCLERMCDIIAGSEDLLVEMVMETARERGIEHAPRSPESWREAVQGLSDAVFQAVYGHLETAGEGPRHDPVVAYGILRGRTQRDRGVLPEHWCALLRIYRHAYVELVKAVDLPPDEALICRRFIAWVFDRMEDGFGQSYPPGCRRAVAGG